MCMSVVKFIKLTIKFPTTQVVKAIGVGKEIDKKTVFYWIISLICLKKYTVK